MTKVTPAFRSMGETSVNRVGRVMLNHILYVIYILWRIYLNNIIHGIYTVSNIQFTYTYQRPDWNSHTVTYMRKTLFCFCLIFHLLCTKMQQFCQSAHLLVSHTVFWDDHCGGAWELFYVSVPHCNLGHKMILQHVHTTLTTFPLKHI